MGLGGRGGASIISSIPVLQETKTGAGMRDLPAGVQAGVRSQRDKC